MAEKLNKVNAGIAASLMVQGGLSTQPIYRYGSEEQKEQFLVPAIKGEKIGAFALTEPNSGSDAASIKTHAKRNGGYYVINGNDLPRRKQTRYLSKKFFVLNVANDGGYNPIRI